MKISFRNLAALLIILLLAACGPKPEPEQSAEPAATPSAQLSVEQAEAADPAEAAVLREAVEESASEPEAVAEEVEESIVLAESAPAGGVRTDWKYSSDKYFLKFTSAQGTSSPPDVIEVAEVFWYGLPALLQFRAAYQQMEASTSERCELCANSSDVEPDKSDSCAHVLYRRSTRQTR